MAIGSLNLKVSQNDFQNRIATVELKMNALMDVIARYETAKANLDQFIEGADVNYDRMIERIDANIEAAKKAHAALNETKASLQKTVDQMQNMGNEVKEVLTSATDATKSAVKAAIKIESIL